MNAHYAVIVAGGSGTRMGSAIPKQFLPLAGRPILMHTLEAFAAAQPEIQLLLVLPAREIPAWQALCSEHKFSLQHTVVRGGNSRFQSVQAGLQEVPADALVAIHDGVRPLLTAPLIQAGFQQAAESGSAVTAVPLKDSIRRLHADGQSEALDRSQYWLVQTPQTFQATLIKAAYNTQEKPFFTDCASVAEAAGHAIKLIEGSYRNLKVTTPEDLVIAEALITSKS